MDRSFPGRTENGAENEGKIRCPDGTFLFFFLFLFSLFFFLPFFSLFTGSGHHLPFQRRCTHALLLWITVLPSRLKQSHRLFRVLYRSTRCLGSLGKLVKYRDFNRMELFHDTNFLMGITGIPSGMYKCYSISLNTFYAIFLSYFTNNVFSDHVSGDRIKES